MLEHGNSVETWPERVLLLGANGFIGSALAASLVKKGVNVTALTRQDVDLCGDGSVSFLAEKISPEDTIVMFAAITPDKGRGVDALTKNVVMMSNLAKAIEKSPPAHLIYFSTDAVYPIDENPVHEGTRTDADDLYGGMHRIRELMAQASNSTDVAILRPTLIYGAADTHNSYGPNRLRRMAQQDAKITLFGEGEETRDHLYIDDAVELASCVISHRSKGSLNLATGNSVSYADLAKLIVAQFEQQPSIEGTPRQNAITHRHFDITALIKAFPDFVFTSIEDGVQKAHQQMMDSGTA